MRFVFNFFKEANNVSEKRKDEDTSNAIVSKTIWVEGLVPGIDFCNHGMLQSPYGFTLLWSFVILYCVLQHIGNNIILLRRQLVMQSSYFLHLN